MSRKLLISIALLISLSLLAVSYIYVQGSNAHKGANLNKLLKSEFSGCSNNIKLDNGAYKISKKAGNSQALVEYSCRQGKIPAKQIAYTAVNKFGKEWHFLGSDKDWAGPTPSCKIADRYNLSRQLTPVCWLGAYPTMPLKIQPVNNP